jgi:outer membrane protein
MKLTIINTLLLVGILSWLVISEVKSATAEKQAYVVTGELFAEFDYQKELDAEYRVIKEKKENELNRFKNELIELENKIRQGLASEEELIRYQTGFQQFQKMEYAVTEELTQINGDYSNRIWDKLNAFIKTYGDENGYDVIFGTAGEGNIMYATDQLNITGDVIAWCNLKYSGKM